eukprot:2728997-Rhodomonas_salina.1
MMPVGPYPPNQYPPSGPGTDALLCSFVLCYQPGTQRRDCTRVLLPYCAAPCPVPTYTTTPTIPTRFCMVCLYTVHLSSTCTASSLHVITQLFPLLHTLSNNGRTNPPRQLETQAQHPPARGKPGRRRSDRAGRGAISQPRLPRAHLSPREPRGPSLSAYRHPTHSPDVLHPNRASVIDEGAFYERYEVLWPYSAMRSPVGCCAKSGRLLRVWGYPFNVKSGRVLHDLLRQVREGVCTEVRSGAAM